ncbi:MAG: type I DNA topoisomerase [Candidatus Omnitrophica bacterium]|nr:type I DNA topoisomerase [Candidatus Omnitrophota bacterium]
MSKSLVIVESPAKARTINKILGADYKVTASMGHVMDLPRSKMGIDVEHDFEPQYIIIPKARKVVTQLKKDAEGRKGVYLATDPDREGEAISAHLAKLLEDGARKMHRVIFHEITETAVMEAFSHPRHIDTDKVNAQQARRVLDRIVGYNLSPLLWKKVGRGLSAGRVQSVALRFICEREKEIQAFKPEEYWTLTATLESKRPEAKGAFEAELEQVAGHKHRIRKEEEAKKILADLEGAPFRVKDVEERKRRRFPSAPYTTSKLQQDSYNQLNFGATKTMAVAQQLYEGVELGPEGSVGLITYMRTDSVHVAHGALEEVRSYIGETFGKEYLPEKPHQYRSKKRAQEAHEAIRPTRVHRTPDSIKAFLTPDQLKLYTLIWRRFVSSQMEAAEFLQTGVDVEAKQYLFHASGQRVLFKGFLAVFPAWDEEGAKDLPALTAGEELHCLKLTPAQHFTQPPPRYSDATLIKMLEEKGIGRPSTYAPTIATILARDYVRRKSGQLHPTELGMIVTDLLKDHFPQIMDAGFTALMELELDEVEEGKRNWREIVKTFYGPFMGRVDTAKTAMKDVRAELSKTDVVCEKCGKPMAIKYGPHGRFLGCTGFPECKSTKSITTGVKCPQPGCDGELVERRARGGRYFYGCSQYPKCRYATHKLPKAPAQAAQTGESR